MTQYIIAGYNVNWVYYDGYNATEYILMGMVWRTILLQVYSYVEGYGCEVGNIMAGYIMTGYNVAGDGCMARSSVAGDGIVLGYIMTDI